MAVLHPPESAYAKERVKWEAQGTEMGPGGRPFVFHRYPMMMHKAGRPENGLGPHVITESREVSGENAQTALEHEGFRETPLEAIDAFEAQTVEIAKLAAEIEYDKKHKLSPGAVAEVEQAQAAHRGHMPTVPETPIKPRGKKE